MGERGRSGIAEIAVIGPSGIETVKRPAPPDELNDEQATEWRADAKAYLDAVRAEEAVSRSISSLSTRLRITQQSIVRAESAHKPKQGRLEDASLASDPGAGAADPRTALRTWTADSWF